MSKFLDIVLQRNDPSVPWGFSIHGGFDKDVAPFVSSVTFGTPAARHLNAGDRVLQIQRQPAGGLLQCELEKRVRDRGKELQLLVEKTSCARTNGHGDVSAGHKSFLRFSEALIEDHFKRVKDLLEDAFSFHGFVIGKQQHQPPVAGNPASDGPQTVVTPPPPPPPPSLPTAIPGRRIRTEIPERGLEPPPAIQNAMLTKDKKPFTYTPGGIDLSEIRSPKMQRRINRNACAEEMTGRPAPTTNHPVPTGPPPSTPYSAMQMQLPTSVLPARGIAAPPPPPPPPPPQPPIPQGEGIVPASPPPPSSANPPSQPKPQSFHKPPQMSFDPNEILARANRNQETAPRKEEEPEKTNVITQSVPKPLNEPGQVYVPPVPPKSPIVEAIPTVPAVGNHSPRGQLGSIYVPPVTNTFQEQTTPSSPFSPKVHTPSPAPTPTSAETKPQAPWVTVYRTPQTAAPSWMSSRQPESPKPQENTRIIPIQIEGRDPPKPQMQPQQHIQPQQYNLQQQQQQQQQQPYNMQQETRQQTPQRPQTRVIPIQIEGATHTGQSYQNKFNPMTPTSPTPYTPPSADKEQKPQWAPVQPRPNSEVQFGQQRIQPEYGTYNTAGVPLSQLRKMQLSEDDRALMDKFKSQIEKHGSDAITDENANPRYRGGHIPSRVFKMLDESVDDETYLHRESDPRYRGAAIPSRAFRLLQNMTDTAGDVPQQVPKGPPRAPASRPAPTTPERTPAPYVPASEQQVQEPRKYTGSSIPSRSFRMLQAMTGQEITAQNHSKANPSSGRSTPVTGTGRWCPSPVHPSVDPYWYLYPADPFLVYNYVPEMYGYFPPQPYYPACCTPTHFQHYPSDSDEQGYSSTDELGQYYANYRHRMACSPFLWNPDPQSGKDAFCASRSATPSITVTPAPARRARNGEPNVKRQEVKEFVQKILDDAKPMEEEGSESSSEEETESETDTDEEEEEGAREYGEREDRMGKSGNLQTLKSVTDVGIYASESTETVTNEEVFGDGEKEEEKEEEEDKEEEEVSSSESLPDISQGNLPHQLSVIYEESEHSDAESMRQKDESTLKSVTSESDASNAENGEEESDGDDVDTESSVTVRLPLRLKFSRGENNEDVTTVIVGDSEVMKSADVSPTAGIQEVQEGGEEEKEEEEEEEEDDDDDADVSVTFSLPSRSNSVISVGRKVGNEASEEYEAQKECERKEEGKKEKEPEAEVTVCVQLKKCKSPEEQKPDGRERRTSDRLSCDSKTEESDSTHCEDDSSSTSVDTVVKPKEDTDEEETEKPEAREVEDFKSWLSIEDGSEWEGKMAEGNEEPEEMSYGAGAERLEKMITSMLDKQRACFEERSGKVRKDNSQEESEDDSGVTSDMSVKHPASETDADTESEYSELSKMSRCQRASTHSRLFKLLQEECGGEDATEEDKEDKPKKEPNHSPSSESLQSRKQRLSLPLNTHSEADSLSSSSGVTSPSSPTVSDRLVKELVQSLLRKKKGKKFRKLPLAKLHAAASRILQEDADACDTCSNSPSGDDGSLLSPARKTEHSPRIAGSEGPDPDLMPDMIYGANYHDYLEYYDTWRKAAPSRADADLEVVPSKAFRMLSLRQNSVEGSRAKCPRIPDGDAGPEKASGRQTPFAAPRHEADADPEMSMSFEEKRERVGKVLENAGK